MPLPLFDDVLVDAVPPRDGPVRIHKGSAPTAAHPTARLSATPFALDGDERPKSHRLPDVRHGTPCYVVFWSNFHRGADGQSPPGTDADEEIARYAKDGFRIGRLFRPLDVVKEIRR